MIGLSHNASVPSSSGLSLRPVGAAPHPTSTGVSRQSSASSPFAARPVVNNDAAPSRPLATRATDTSRQLPGASHSTPITVPDGTAVVAMKSDLPAVSSDGSTASEVAAAAAAVDHPSAEEEQGAMTPINPYAETADADVAAALAPPTTPPRRWVAFAVAGGVTALSILGAILFGDA